MLIISYLILILVSPVLIWGLIIYITIIGLFNIKTLLSSPTSMLYYFFVQELGGLCFVISISGNLSLIALLLKGGFAPFHFWMGKVVSGCGASFAWLITTQNMPYYVVTSLFLTYSHVLFIFFASILPLLQGLFAISHRNIYFFAITSSGSLILVWGSFDIISTLFVCPLYLALFYSLLGDSNALSVKSFELYLIIIGFPINLPFFVKLYSTCHILSGGGLVLLLILIYFVLFMVLGLPLLYGGGSLHHSNKLMSPFLFVFMYIYMLVS